MSSIKEERYKTERATRYTRLSGYENFDEWKDKIKRISGHKGILKYLTNEWEILKV